MTKLNNYGVPLGAEDLGILQPARMHKFKLAFARQENISKQVMSCTLNIHNNTLEVIVRQPIVSNILTNIIDTKRNEKITLELKDGPGETTHFIQMFDCNLISHYLIFDYGDGNVAHNKLVYSYSYLEEKDVR